MWKIAKKPVLMGGEIRMSMGGEGSTTCLKRPYRWAMEKKFQVVTIFQKGNKLNPSSSRCKGLKIFEATCDELSCRYSRSFLFVSPFWIGRGSQGNHPIPKGG